MTERRRPVRRSLSGTLALAFVIVGVLTSALVIGIVMVTARSQSASVSQGSRSAAGADVTSALRAAYTAAGDRWSSADLTPAARRARAAQAALVVRDGAGRIVGVFTPSGRALGASALRLPASAAASDRLDVVANGRRVGSAELRFAGSGLTRGEQRLRDALVRSAIIASAVAVLVALLAAAWVVSRIRRPLLKLAGAAGELESGNAEARVRVPDAPGELGELSVAFDRMADALAAQQSARAAMTSELAHELRTPLTILRGNLEEMIDGDLAPDPAALSSLQDEVLRLERLTDDLRALSESEPSFLQLAKTRLDLTAVVSDAAAALEPSARSAGVTLSVVGSPVFVNGDARRLGQVAANLLVNAIKFSPDGGSVEAAIAEDQGWATLVVADTGPGIPAAELPHVFERFWRGAGARTVSGTGVGLAIVERLVGAHGGSVAAASPPGSGARFTVRLPLG